MRTEHIGDAAAAGAGQPIELRGISKAFAGIKVVNDVSFDMRPGEVHALMGENGAGKSTLMKIIAGEIDPLGGQRTPAADLEVGFFAQLELEQLDVAEYMPSELIGATRGPNFSLWTGRHETDSMFLAIFRKRVHA